MYFNPYSNPRGLGSTTDDILSSLTTTAPFTGLALLLELGVGLLGLALLLRVGKKKVLAPRRKRRAQRLRIKAQMAALRAGL